MRFGRGGAAAAAWYVTFNIGWTLINATGVNGSLPVFLSLTLAATVSFGAVYVFLLNEYWRRAVASLSSGRLLNSDPTAKSPAIGIVAPISFWSTDYYVLIIRAIRAAADREQRTLRRRVVVLDIAHEEVVDVEATLGDVLLRNVSGIISINTMLNEGARADLVAMKTPVVYVSHADESPPSICSIQSSFKALETLMRDVLTQFSCTCAILITKGMGNPFKGISVDPIRREKREIFQRVTHSSNLVLTTPITLADIAASRIAAGCGYVVEIDAYDEEIGGLLFSLTADVLPENTALFFLADEVALGFMYAAAATGRDIWARRLRITGVDNTAAGRRANLTSLDYQHDLIGRLAYERLQRALDYPDQRKYAEELVETQAVIRQSSHWQPITP